MVSEYLLKLLPPELPATVGDLPATSTEAIALIELDSDVSTEYFGPRQGSSIFNPLIKIVERTASYAQGKAWGNQIKTLLHRYHDDMLMSVMAVGDLIYLGRNEQKLHEFQITFQVQVKE